MKQSLKEKHLPELAKMIAKNPAKKVLNEKEQNTTLEDNETTMNEEITREPYQPYNENIQNKPYQRYNEEKIKSKKFNQETKDTMVDFVTDKHEIPVQLENNSNSLKSSYNIVFVILFIM